MPHSGEELLEAVQGLGKGRGKKGVKRAVDGQIVPRKGKGSVALARAFLGQICEHGFTWTCETN